MNLGLQVFVGVIAGAVMLGRIGAAVCRARIDGRIAARRVRFEDDVHERTPEHSLQ